MAKPPLKLRFIISHLQYSNRMDEGIALVRMRNHSNYDQEFKKKVIITAEKTSNREAEKLFGISESNIRRWRKLKGEIFGFGPSCLDRNRRKRKIHLKGRVQKRVPGKGFENVVIEEFKMYQDSPSSSLGIMQ